MTDTKEQQDVDRSTLPFVAPCRELSPFAPFRWVKHGISDLIQAPRESMLYGLVMASIMATVSIAAWS